MAEISFFVYAENSLMQQVPTPEQVTEAKLQLMSPNFLFRPQFVPCLFSYAVAVGVHDFDVKIPHEMQMMVHYNDEGPALADTGVMNLPAFPENGNEDLPKKLYVMKDHAKAVLSVMLGKYVGEMGK